MITITQENLARRCFTVKLGSMRKPQEFIVYSQSESYPTQAVIQSDKSIGAIDLETGEGKLYQGKGEHPSFMHLTIHGRLYTYPPEVIATVKRILGYEIG